MRVRLGATANADPQRSGPLAADDEGGAAVGHRTAVEQLERHRHRLGRHHIGDRDRLLELRAGMGAGMRAHQHRELGEILLGHAVFVHVPAGNEAVIGGDGRAQRDLVIGMADLGQRLDRGIAALPGETVLAGNNEDVARHAGLDEMMREHGHRKPGRAADLHGVGVSRADAKMLGEYGREHDMRRDGGVAAEDSVDLGALQPGIVERELGCVAHQVERGRAFMLAERREADAADEAHGPTPSFRGATKSRARNPSPGKPGG